MSEDKLTPDSDACEMGWLVDCVTWHPRCAEAQVRRLRAEVAVLRGRLAATVEATDQFRRRSGSFGGRP